MANERLQEADRIQIEGRWYVLATAARFEEQPQALKRDDMFALFDRFGDIVPWERGEHGLYTQDTRFVSHLELLLNGARPLHLNTSVKDDGSALIVELMNADLRRGSQHIPASLDLDAIGFLQALIGHQIGDAVSVDSEGGAVVETSAPCNVLYTAR